MDWFEVTKFAFDNLITDDCIGDYTNGEQRSKQDPLNHCRPTVYFREFYNIYTLFLIEHFCILHLILISGWYWWVYDLCLTSFYGECYIKPLVNYSYNEQTKLFIAV